MDKLFKVRFVGTVFKFEAVAFVFYITRVTCFTNYYVFKVSAGWREKVGRISGGLEEEERGVGTSVGEEGAENTVEEAKSVTTDKKATSEVCAGVMSRVSSPDHHLTITPGTL